MNFQKDWFTFDCDVCGSEGIIERKMIPYARCKNCNTSYKGTFR